MIIAAISPEWYGVIGVLVLVFALNLAFCYATQAGMIARATTKEAVRQPLFPLLIVIGIIVLLVNTFVPMFTLGDDFKMLMDCGLATILICGLLMGVWTSSTSVSAEIEGKTAMTLLSKPINRRQFIVGKYMGILNA
ncbi:MAG TPA: ABC transporter permease subunit, partial [Planctomycetaceae bacterium]|nr:ABC transporter permease subunit [Planctomycetaceae bacterium]